MKKKVLFGLSLLFGLMMVNSGFNKFFHYMPYPPMPEAATNFMGILADSYIWPIVAICEIVGGILLIIPKTRALGAIILVPIMIAILFFHVSLDPHSTWMIAIMWGILGWIIFENREKYIGLIED